MANEDKKVEWVRIDGDNVDLTNVKQDVVEQARNKIEQCEQAVAAARADGNRQEEATQLTKLGDACLLLGQAKRAIEAYEEARVIFHELGNDREEANSHTHLGQAYLFMKDAKNIHAHYVQAWEIFKNIGDQAGVAGELRNLASFYSFVEQPERAAEFYRHTAAIYRELGDRDKEANALASLGVVYMEVGQVESAIELQEQALTLFRQVGNRAEEATALINLGGFHLQSRRWDSAMEYYNQALVICRETGDRSKEALVLKSMGLVYFGMKQLEKAIDVTRSSVKIYEEGGFHGAENARKQLEQLSKVVVSRKSPTFIVVPIGLILMLIMAILINLLNRNSNSGTTRTSGPTTLSLLTSTGTIAGMVVDKNRQPLVNTGQGQVGIIALFCPTDVLDVECLHENDMDMDVSFLISSICDQDDTSESCLLHWDKSAVKIGSGGSYILRNVSPGQYDLILIIVDSGIAVTMHAINVDPIQPGGITLYDIVTE